MFYEWREIKTWPSVEDGIYQRFEKGAFKCWVVKTATVGDRATVGEWARVGEWASLALGAYLFRNTTDEPPRTAYVEPDWKQLYFEASGQAITFKLERDRSREELAKLKAATGKEGKPAADPKWPKA